SSDHLLLTPDTFVRAPLPGMKNATAIIHVGPVTGARFTQFTVEFEDGGVLGPATVQRFVYVLEGEVSIAGRNLGPGDYAYSPGTSGAIINARTASRAAVFEKAYQQLAGVPAPEFFTGQESKVKAEPLRSEEHTSELQSLAYLV